MKGCLDETTVLAFLDGALAAEARGAAETHLAGCSGCMDLTTWAAANAANHSREPGRERRPFIGQLETGTRVGRYQILAPVGRGGMGEVYAAYHPDLDRRIALKVVYETDAGSAERRARLLREARAIARLSHPNVVVVHDAGTVGDRVFIAMEFVEGETIDEWLRREPRSWREILDVFIAAGRGLEAAHAAGIVHRDFKPENVMVAKDGSVRVMDFGLARMGGETAGAAGDDARVPLAPDDDSGTTTKMTRTGTLLGTPAYMAPEQFRGEPSDARADQFSFCVALYEALYGVRPTPEPVAATRAPSSSERRSGAPGKLREVILSGLAARADDRHVSMAHLLRALVRVRTLRLRRAGAAAAGLCLALAISGGWRLSHAHRYDCAAPRDRMSAAWGRDDPSDARRRAVRGALLATGRADAATIWQRVSTALDQHMGRWGNMYQEACEATHHRGEQSEDVLDLRMRCLNESLDQVRSLTDVLASADAPAAAGALSATTQLTPVSRCADIRLLRSTVPLPRDERVLEEVRRLQRQLADAQALHDVGRVPAAFARASAIRPQVEATGYRPLLASLLELVGRTQVTLSAPAEAEATFHQAFCAAQAGTDDAMAARISGTLAYVIGVLEAQPEDGLRWSRVANAILDRGGIEPTLLRAWALQDEGAILGQIGELERARGLFLQAAAIKEKLLGREHPDVAISLSALGITLTALGDVAAALGAHERALAIVDKSLDPSSTVRADVFNGFGEALLASGRLAEATSALELSLRVHEAANPESVGIAFPLTALGRLAVVRHDPNAALPLLERALNIRARNVPKTADLAETQFALASALWAAGSDRTRALSLARSARTQYAVHRRTRATEEIDRWLAAHGGHRE